MPYAQICEEMTDPETGYSIDIVVKCGNARGGIAVEVDGPSHFLRGTRDPTGATVMKRRHLGMCAPRMKSLDMTPRPFLRHLSASISKLSNDRH